MLPSGPGPIPPGRLPAFRPFEYSVIACVVGLIVPIAGVLPLSVNQRLPSGPAAILPGTLPAWILNSVITCVVGLIVPIAPVVPGSTNQRLASVPTAIAAPGALPAFRPVLHSAIAWGVRASIP